MLTIAAAGMGALLAFLPAAGHDQLWCLYVARRVLDGTPLYGPQLMESNPPLIIWLSLLPVLLERLLHLPAAALGKGLVVLLDLEVAAICARQLRRLLPPVSASQLAALAFAFVVLFNVVPARDLGQRDYLLALLCLPYLISAAGRLSQPAQNSAALLSSVAIGLAAGVGIALKPHQAILPIAVELFLLVRSRQIRSLLRPEPCAILVAGVVYVAAVHSVTPAYFTTILPILRDTYWAVGSLSLPQLIWEAVELHVLATVAFVVYFRFRRGPADTATSALAALFLVAGCASTLAYYLQGTGWYYQQLPAITFFAFALVLMLLPSLHLQSPRWLLPSSIGLSVLALALTTHFMDYPFTEARSFPIDTPDPALFANLPPGTPVATLTTTVDDTVMPAARFHLTIAQRYPHLWMLPAILRNEQPDARHPPSHIIPPARLAELDALQHRFMVEDLERWKPPLVLVEHCQKPGVHCQLLEDRDDDLLAWFLRDPAFAAAWKPYTFVVSRGPYDAYARTSP